MCCHKHIIYAYFLDIIRPHDAHSRRWRKPRKWKESPCFSRCSRFARISWMNTTFHKMTAAFVCALSMTTSHLVSLDQTWCFAPKLWMFLDHLDRQARREKLTSWQRNWCSQGVMYTFLPLSMYRSVDPRPASPCCREEGERCWELGR